MAENYGVYEDQRKKYLDSLLPKETPFSVNEDLSPANKRAIANPIGEGTTTVNTVGSQGTVVNPNSDSMASFTPREEIGGTYGTRIGGNGIATPMNSLEDVNKNVASFETPKDFTTEVIRGNQRSLYGYDKGGMTVPTVKNPFERENEERRSQDTYNQAINVPGDYTRQYDKHGNLIGESYKSNFNEGLTGYANAIKPGINQDIAELRNQFMIDKMNSDWNNRFTLEQMRNDARLALKQTPGARAIGGEKPKRVAYKDNVTGAINYYDLNNPTDIQTLTDWGHQLTPVGKAYAVPGKRGGRSLTTPAQPAVNQQKTVVATGTYNGRKVVKYSDGSIDYAY